MIAFESIITGSSIGHRIILHAFRPQNAQSPAPGAVAASRPAPHHMGRQTRTHFDPDPSEVVFQAEAVFQEYPPSIRRHPRTVPVD